MRVANIDRVLHALVRGPAWRYQIAQRLFEMGYASDPGLDAQGRVISALRYDRTQAGSWPADQHPKLFEVVERSGTSSRYGLTREGWRRARNLRERERADLAAAIVEASS